MRLLYAFIFAGLIPLSVSEAAAGGDPPAAFERSAFDVLKDFGNAFGGGAGGREFLEPDRAFVLSVDVKNPYLLLARWDVEEGYYLYRDKFSFSVNHPGVTVGPFHVPSGTVKDDPTFGQVEINTGHVEVEVPLTRKAATELPLNLVVRYQGCAEDGICYPPIEKIVPVSLNAAPSPAAAEPALSVEDGLARRLAGDATLATLASFLGFGLLLSFTPCVFPMVPILSGIIAGKGGDGLTPRKAFVFSTVYVLAMAVTYAVIGVVAGLFGENLQAVFQNPWVLVAFAAVLVIFALSMFGLFEIQLPAGWQSGVVSLSNRQARGRLHGVAGMGLLSALIVGPCVAPPLAGALIYIGQTGDAALGGLALFCLGLGMGLPLILIGTAAGKLLPKAGAWMERVRGAFGVVLLAIALWLLERVLPGPVIVLLWGVLLITTAIYLGATDRLDPLASGWRRLSKGVGLAVLTYGAALIVGAAGGASDIFRPLGDLSLATKGSNGRVARLAFHKVKGAPELDQALREAKTQAKPVVLDLYADWCVECKQLDKHTFGDSAVRQVLATMVLLQADVTANDAVDKELLRSLGVYGPPAVLFFGPDTAELRQHRVVGFVGPDEFLAHLKAVSS